MHRLIALALVLGDSPAPLTVHEWGTFTFVQGSDGVTLDGLTQDDADLPPFVVRRGAGRRPARTKMETPVTYFYTPVERTVRVSVDFPGGALTHWFPRADASVPSRLDWGTVALVPPERFSGSLPDASASAHYLPARDVDAAIVRVDAPRSPEHERFLFYRGLGTFPSPLAVETTSFEDSPAAIRAFVEARNAGALDLEHVYGIAVHAGRASFSYAPRLRAGQTWKAILEAGPDHPTVDATARQLEAHVEARLRALGLYEKEARAMVRSWTESWFRTPGVRVFFAFPRVLADSFLPLRVEPAPDETVRVMIGRVECVTPAQERAFEAAAARLGSADPAEAAAARSAILGLGRIAEPMLRRSADLVGARELLEALGVPR
jgi:hypothetical protein